MEHDRLMNNQTTLTQMDFFEEQKESAQITKKNQTTLTQMDFFGEKNNATTYTNEVRMIMGYYCSACYFIVCIMMSSISTHTYIPLYVIITIILTPGLCHRPPAPLPPLQPPPLSYQLLITVCSIRHHHCSCLHHQQCPCKHPLPPLPILLLSLLLLLLLTLILHIPMHPPILCLPLDIKLDVTTIAKITELVLVPRSTQELAKRKNNIHHTNAQPEAKSLAMCSQASLIMNGVLPSKMEQRET